jgi:hypothetical protein
MPTLERCENLAIAVQEQALLLGRAAWAGFVGLSGLSRGHWRLVVLQNCEAGAHNYPRND